MPENKLTDKHLRTLKPTDTEQLLGDGGGLWVRALPKGANSKPSWTRIPWQRGQ